MIRLLCQAIRRFFEGLVDRLADRIVERAISSLGNGSLEPCWLFHREFWMQEPINPRNWICTYCRRRWTPYA